METNPIIKLVLMIIQDRVWILLGSLGDEIREPFEEVRRRGGLVTGGSGGEERSVNRLT